MNVMILAAGKGSRMNSPLPKPLLKVHGRPMLDHVLDAALLAHPEARPVVVVGHGHSHVVKALSNRDVAFAYQNEQLGTGHAAKISLPYLDGSPVLVLFGDVPLLTPAALMALSAEHSASGRSLTLLSTTLPTPFGYGRIVRDNDSQVQAIVEEKDASDAERALTEVNTGIMLLSHALLVGFCADMGCNNAQGEYYLTDIVAYARENGHDVGAYVAPDPDQFLGANTPEQLAELDALFAKRVAN